MEAAWEVFSHLLFTSPEDREETGGPVAGREEGRGRRRKGRHELKDSNGG